MQNESTNWASNSQAAMCFCMFSPTHDHVAWASCNSMQNLNQMQDESLKNAIPPKPAMVVAATMKPDGGFRPFHDATHSVMVNHSIQYRDQLQCPGPAEVAALVREAAESKEAPFFLSGH